MTGSQPRPLHLRSDLHLVVDGAPAEIVADGQQLTIETEDAGRLLTQAVGSVPSGLDPLRSLRRIAAQAGRALDDAGLSAQLIGGNGPLMELGRGCHSLVARVLLGTEQARLGDPGALAELVTGYVRASDSIRRRASYAGAGLAIATVFAVAGTRRRRIDL